MKKYRVGIVGATGMVGQRLIMLLNEHPWFDISVLAASINNKGKIYGDAVSSRWVMSSPIPERIANMLLEDGSDVESVCAKADFIFCAISMDKVATKELEEAYAKSDTPVVSNNSACRGLDDVPMMIPEINYEHCSVIETQRKRLGTALGFIAVKPNCSIQSYVPALTPLLDFGVEKISVCTYQAISGAGKTFATDRKSTRLNSSH